MFPEVVYTTANGLFRVMQNRDTLSGELYYQPQQSYYDGRWQNFYCSFVSAADAICHVLDEDAIKFRRLGIG